jgi:LmbE family N-acetylglucosaminyl deacetylase
MKSKVLVIAPHADDEVLGVGGTLLKLKEIGSSINWLLVTSPNKNLNWNIDQLNKRKDEINEISKRIGFDNVYKLKLPSSSLDTIPFGQVVKDINEVIKDLKPNEIFIPHNADVHTDHGIVHKASISSSKSFRHPYIKRILVYETLSETEFGLDRSNPFHPNLFVDISNYLDKKIELMKIYSSEISDFPFPRSIDSIISLAKFRGSTAAYKAAEAFQILKSKE